MAKGQMATEGKVRSKPQGTDMDVGNVNIQEQKSRRDPTTTATSCSSSTSGCDHFCFPIAAALPVATYTSINLLPLLKSQIDVLGKQ
jgi:hypothetical protein